MKKNYTLLTFLFCFCFFNVFAQNPYQIKGTIVDSTANLKLPNTVISILNAKDSTLFKFTRAAANGSFIIPNLKKGKFIILVTYPEYADFVDNFTLDSTKQTIDFKTIDMRLKATVLNEVIIKGQAASMKIKGDTTEFNAGSFKVQPNAKVEDLLKQLPGIQVDKDGKITSYDKAVEKVLVDGEEFFGDDPTLVTKNLRADMIDKVQVFDKTSDQAAFTGVDDGQKAKTINLKLKEDKKNGYFGKLDGGIGTDGFYEGQAMFNRFKAKQKFSAFGTSSSTGKTGLGWEDRQRFGGGDQNIEFVDGGMMISSSGDDMGGWGGRYDGQGIPLANNGAVHYDNKWNKDKESINTNYKVGALNVNGVRNNLSQNNLPNGLINTNSDQIFNTDNFRQKLDATYQIKLDTTSNLKVSIDGSLRNTISNSGFITGSARGDNSLLNSTIRDLSNNADQQLFNASAFYTKKLKKTGRTLSVNLNQAINQNQATGFLKSENRFYGTNNNLLSTQIIDQFKTNDTKSATLNTNLTYTEPITKAFSVVLNYGLGIASSSANRISFNASTPGNYDVFDALFSNKFELDQTTNLAGAVFNYKKNKSTVNFGTKINAVNFNQFDVYTNKTYHRDFLNWLPQATFSYKFSQQKSFSLRYNGSTTQPTLEQVQQIRVNTDPLNETLGNPNLKPSFNNNINVNYNSYKVLSGQSIYAYGSYSFNTNQIVSNTITDLKGKSTTQAINLINKTPYNYYAYLSTNSKIKAIDLNISLGLDLNGNVNYSYINNEINTSKSSSYGPNLSLSKYKEKKYEFYISFNPNFNLSTATSLQQMLNNSGWTFGSNASFLVFLPGKFQISSEAEYEYRAPTESFNEDFKRLLWKASVSRTFLKENNLKLAITGNDLLNQNLGFDRRAFGNMITQNSFTTIRRYFMFALTWDFNKMGFGDKKQN